jgi:hypothetical protein
MKILVHVDTDGNVIFNDGNVVIQPDGTFKTGKLQANPDGSLIVGEALSIDPNGIMTLNGAEFRIQNGYNLIFDSGGGPVIPSRNGSKFKVIVADDGTLSTVPA